MGIWSCSLLRLVCEARRVLVCLGHNFFEHFSHTINYLVLEWLLHSKCTASQESSSISRQDSPRLLAEQKNTKPPLWFGQGLDSLTSKSDAQERPSQIAPPQPSLRPAPRFPTTQSITTKNNTLLNSVCLLKHMFDTVECSTHLIHVWTPARQWWMYLLRKPQVNGI